MNQTELTDRVRVSLTLQAAGLLAHLRAAGWKLVGELEQGVIDDGVLCGLSAQPGSDQLPMHQRLRAYLLALFRCEVEVAGSGQARRSARKLTVAWAQPLAPLTADEILRQILYHAPFLWNEEFKRARHALFAGIDDEAQPRAVGPARFSMRIERRLASGEDLDQLLASDSFHAAWEGAGSADPMQLAEAGRWVEAVSTFRVRGARGEEERTMFATALLAVGKFEQALEVIERVRGWAADEMRLHCLTRLQRLEAARRLLIRVQERRLTAQQQVAIGDVALRVFGNVGDSARVEEWKGRLGRIRSTDVVDRSRVILASAAFDADDPEAARPLLESSARLREDSVDGWRWHNADGLRALAESDGARAGEAFRTALVGSRRNLTRVRAALLWTNMVSAAELSGDLPAAEKAARTAYRLGMGFEGPLRNTVFLYNLAEVLLKRGKVDGVRELVDEVLAADRQAGNRRGLAHDAELTARYHLTRGRADRALRVIDELLGDDCLNWRRPQLLAWSARALGLLERPREAAERLCSGGSGGLAGFEREEIPAIWALAGDPDAALGAVEGPSSELWVGVISGQPPPRERWDLLGLMEPYSAARLVRDLEMVSPGCVPRQHRLHAIRVLRNLGLEPVAQTLERITGGAWAAVNAYLEAETGGDLATLFADAGYGDVRLEWDGPGAEVLVNGRGGGQRYESDLGAGRLILDADSIDQPLLTLVALARREVEQRPGRAAGVSAAPGGIVGESPALRAALNDVRLLAPSDLPILILGETGTGKELVARWAHAQSDRAKGLFLPVNCAAISDSLRNSELFGHAKGAFTGAEQDREGYFEAADGGTIFLDEIGDLTLDAQAGLLRVLQESEVTRVGESRPRSVDTRMIAATHRDLKRMLADGVFRQDLYYRVNQLVVELPPLRDRGDDVLLLARHFLGKAGRGGRPVAMDREAIDLLRRLPWPGNVRELQSVLRAAALYSEGERIARLHLRIEEEPGTGALKDFQTQVGNFRRRLIVDTLKRGNGNQAEAARYLGMTRQNLSYWIKKLGIGP